MTGAILKREVRVALSKKAQPVWFRLLKWVVILFVCWSYRQAPYFGFSLGLVFLLGFGLHLFWRYKTKGWTQAWGGWNDLDSANK